MAPTPAGEPWSSPNPASVRSPTRLPIGPTPSSRTDHLIGSHNRVSSLTSGTSGPSYLPTHSITRAHPDLPPSSSPTSATFAGSAHGHGVQPASQYLRNSRTGAGGSRSGANMRITSPPSRPASAASATSAERLSRTLQLDSDIDEDGEYTAAPGLLFTIPPITSSVHDDGQKNLDPFAPIGAPITHVSSKAQPPPQPQSQPQLQSPPRSPPTSMNKKAWRESVDRLFRRLSASTDGHGAAQPLSFMLVDSDLHERETMSTTPRTSGVKARSMGSTPTPLQFAPKKTEDLSAVPVLNANGKPKRKWEAHPSNNTFFFAGRVLTGGDQPYAFIASLTLLLGISGTWFGTTCVWWWHNLSPAVAAVGAYMLLLTLTTMLSTALRDPGILPRGLDPDPPYPSGRSAGSDPAPLPRDIRVRAGTVRVKYCSTCRTYRPPRSSHCKMCDNCVEGCDHHCQWVNNCVGHRNYTSFFAFLTSTVLTSALVIVTSAIHIAHLAHEEHSNGLGRGFVHALSRGAGSAVVFSLTILMIWPITALALYHVRLLLLNVTTIEQIRNTAHKTLVPGPAPPNPFSHGSWRRNLLNVLCRPAGSSWLDAHAIATEDKRAVNPAN